MEFFKSGVTVGNGAAINVQLGWVPDRVEVYNATDGDLVTTCYPRLVIVPFSGAGTTEIFVGDTITGQTSGATLVIREILVYSGTLAAGNLAGFYVGRIEDLVGTFQSEDIVGSRSASDATDDATVTVNAIEGFGMTGDIAAVTTAATQAIGYAGAAASAAQGFTIGATVAEEAKILRWSAWRDDR